MKTITTIGILAAALAATPLAAQQSGMAGMDHSQMRDLCVSRVARAWAVPMWADVGWDRREARRGRGLFLLWSLIRRSDRPLWPDSTR